MSRTLKSYVEFCGNDIIKKMCFLIKNKIKWEIIHFKVNYFPPIDLKAYKVLYYLKFKVFNDVILDTILDI